MVVDLRRVSAVVGLAATTRRRPAAPPMMSLNPDLKRSRPTRVEERDEGNELERAVESAGARNYGRILTRRTLGVIMGVCLEGFGRAGSRPTWQQRVPAKGQGYATNSSIW